MLTDASLPVFADRTKPRLAANVAAPWLRSLRSALVCDVAESFPRATCNAR
jgi:hypothetical protein